MLADFKRPRGYRFVAELPRTATGKKMHYRIRDEARAAARDDYFQRP